MEGEQPGRMEFFLPSLSQSVRDLELDQGSHKYRVNLAVDLSLESPSSQRAFVESLQSTLLSSSDVCNLSLSESWLDSIYSIVRFFPQLAPGAKSQATTLLQSLTNQVLHQIQHESDHSECKNALRAVGYWLAKTVVDQEQAIAKGDMSFESTQDKGKGKSKRKPKKNLHGDDDDLELGSSWEELRAVLISSLSKILSEESVEFRTLWKCGLPEESFLDLFWRVSETVVLSNPKILQKPEEKELLEDLICLPAHKFHETISHVIVSSFSHSLGQHEQMASFISSVMKRLVGKYNDDRLGREMILEVGREESMDTSKDSTNVRNLGILMESLANDVPTLLLSHLSLVVTYLNAQAYSLRCSMVRALGALVAFLRNGDANKEGDTQATRDKILDLIGERAHDTSSYVRSATLSTFQDLSSASCLPTSHLHVTCDIANERILDKSSLVRKQAIACLTSLLENNPFSDRLDPMFFKEKVMELDQELRKHPQNENQQQQQTRETESPDDDLDTAKESSKEEEKDDDESKGEEDTDMSVKEEKEKDTEDGDEEAENDPRVIAALTFFKSALSFTARMEETCRQAEKLVCSKIMTDVLESIRFLAAALRFRVPAALDSMRKMLFLIWDDRESGRIRKEILEVFELIFISEPVQVGRTTKRKLFPESEIASSLINLVLHATLSELTSLEKIIGELVSVDGTLKRLSLPTFVVEKVWDIACDQDHEASEEYAGDVKARQTAAMCLVAMIVSSSSTLFERRPANIRRLLSLLEETDDSQLLRYGFQILRRIFSAGQVASTEYREQVEQLTMNFLRTSPRTEATLDWYPAAEQAILLLALCAPRPDQTFALLVRQYHKSVFPEGRKPKEGPLGCFLFVLGHVAIQLFVHAEDVSKQAKLLRKGREEEKEAKERLSKAEQEELTMLGAGGDVADDYEEVVLKRIAEHELVDPKSSLLGMYLPLLSDIVRRGLAQDKVKGDDDDEQQDVEGVKKPSRIGKLLMESATLCLCKIMCISSVVCDKYLRLVLTVLRDAKDPKVRSNIMIALGDLAVRFPNSIEPYTSEVYRRLRDPDVGVRKTSLMVLSHLILNDMIKVRGEVSEIVLCIEDKESERISDLACLLFHELSRKGTHPVYNLLPDTLNKLSKEPNIDQAQFKRLAKFLLQFITLDKHIQGITEKLCQRIFLATGLTPGMEEVESLSTVKELRLCQDLAFCIGHLKLSDRAVAKLMDPLFKLYKPVLADDAVFESFLSLAKKAKQFSKPELKQSVDQWIVEMETVRGSHASNHATTDKARKKTNTRQAKEKPANKSQRKSTRRKTKAKSISSEEDSDTQERYEDSENEEESQVEGEEEESEVSEEEEEVASVKQKAMTKRSSRVRTANKENVPLNVKE